MSEAIFLSWKYITPMMLQSISQESVPPRQQRRLWLWRRKLRKAMPSLRSHSKHQAIPGAKTQGSERLSRGSMLRERPSTDLVETICVREHEQNRQIPVARGHNPMIPQNQDWCPPCWKVKALRHSLLRGPILKVEPKSTTETLRQQPMRWRPRRGSCSMGDLEGWQYKAAERRSRILQSGNARKALW